MQNNTFSTLFIAQNLIHLQAVDSTNNYLKLLVSKSEPVAEGTVIMADDQFSGRGQQGNKWLSKPGLNLTFSIYLRPLFLGIHQQFMLNIAISLGIINALHDYIPEGVKIKWPNDIYFERNKIGGILIENTILGSAIKSSVVGIGINVNQRAFNDFDYGRPSSISEILQQDVDLWSLLNKICQGVEAQYLRLRSGVGAIQHKEYIENLYQFNEFATYKVKEKEFVGRISNVTKTGELLVSTDDGEQCFSFKEIEFLNKN